MEYNHVLINFCERKLNPNQPEYINAFSALYISAIGYYNLRTALCHSSSIYIIYWCIIINGFASFLYHWYAWYIFKLFDEFTMIIPVWFGISKILFDLNYNMHYIGLFTLFNMVLMVVDVYPWFDSIFPICFATELIIIIPLYCKALLRHGNDHSYEGLKGIIICSGSGIAWIITELYCNEYLIFGHAIWHIGVSTGLCSIIDYFSVVNLILKLE